MVSTSTATELESARLGQAQIRVPVQHSSMTQGPKSFLRNFHLLERVRPFLSATKKKRPSEFSESDTVRRGFPLPSPSLPLDPRRASLVVHPCARRPLFDPASHPYRSIRPLPARLCARTNGRFSTPVRDPLLVSCLATSGAPIVVNCSPSAHSHKTSNASTDTRSSPVSLPLSLPPLA